MPNVGVDARDGGFFTSSELLAVVGHATNLLAGLSSSDK